MRSSPIGGTRLRPTTLSAPVSVLSCRPEQHEFDPTLSRR